ncbi:MAG: metallophosphoesterase [Lactobacillales bacterium]|nr:metallophosphoesterase [Lactobacillales bacterium]
MKRLHTTTYKLYNKDNIRISIISDIHFSHGTLKKLNILLKHLTNIKPNYILIPGDLIDCSDILKDNKVKDEFLIFIKSLSKISKVVISLGNHDFYKIKKRKLIKNSYENYFSYQLFYEISLINNVYLLDNDKYEDKKIYIAGITVPLEYYKDESSNSLSKKLNRNKKIISDLPEDKLKILMIHSPMNLNNKRIKNKLKEFDYFVCGHMHNGCVPPIINELWNSSKGIIGPTGKFLVFNARNTLRKKEDKLLVNGPVITFSKCSGIMRIFNIFYPIYNTILDFNKKNEFKIKRKYHK